MKKEDLSSFFLAPRLVITAELRYSYTMHMKYVSLIFLFFPAAVLAAPVSAAQPAAPALTVTVGSYTDTVSADTYSQWTSQQTSLAIDDSYQSQVENIALCPAPDKTLCDLLLTTRDRDHFRVRSQAVVNTDAITAYLNALAAKADSTAQDATFAVDNGQVTTFSPESDGITLDVAKSLPLIEDAVKNSPTLASNLTIKLPFDTTKPNITTSEINNLGIATLIGEGTSNFVGSPKNRIVNINAGAKRFNGVLIKPGEEFSFITTLGPVDADHGYLPELVIKGNATEPDYGGGICQVSTTAFRAAINSGLKITARTNHAYPVSYYNPQGMDATVFIPKPDLKFTNNTPGDILIQTKVTGTILTFDFYGTNDGRKTTIQGPTITDRQPDGSMKAQFTQLVVDKDGNQIISDVFKSVYKSPYLFPHPGGVVLSVKPANWSDDQWKAYQQMIKDMAKAAANPPK